MLRVTRNDGESIEDAIVRHAERHGERASDVLDAYREHLADGLREDTAALEALFGFDCDDTAEETED